MIDNGKIRITKEGVVFLYIDKETAFEIFQNDNSELYKLNDDGSESVIETENDFDECNNYSYAIELTQIDSDTAKSILKHQGYQTNNLWHIDDIQDNYEATEEEAMNLLEKTFTNNSVVNNIWESIDIIAKIEGLERHEEE